MTYRERLTPKDILCSQCQTYYSKFEIGKHVIDGRCVTLGFDPYV